MKKLITALLCALLCLPMVAGAASTPISQTPDAGTLTGTEKIPIGRVGGTTAISTTTGALLNRANHTGTQAATTVAEDSTHRFATDAEKSTWNAKQDAYSVLTTLGGLSHASGWLKNDGAGVLSYATPAKADLGLGNVENTAISTWAGSVGVNTLGTITSGTWHGSAIGDDYISSSATWNAKQNALGFTPLAPSNNLSDVVIPATARANLGLGNVDNTSDASKPISTATQTALNAKQSLNLIDTVTGTVYRLSIDNGVLQLEEQ